MSSSEASPLLPNHSDPLSNPPSSPADLYSSTNTKTHTLPSGRQISYTTHGSPSARPLILLHGVPGTRLLGAALAPYATLLNLYIITPDRPSIGLSTSSPSQSLQVYASDILHLADGLELLTFRVLGLSGGGPFALACARYLPVQRCVGAGVLAGLGPYAVLGAWGRSWGNMAVFWGARYAPFVLRKVVEATSVRLARDADPRRFELLCEYEMRGFEGRDRVCLGDEDVLVNLVKGAAEFWRGGSQGFMTDLGVLTRDWGFDPSEIESPERVRLWYAADDVNVPLSHGTWIRDRLTGCRWTEWEGETHIGAWTTRREEVLRTLFDDEDQGPSRKPEQEDGEQE